MSKEKKKKKTVKLKLHLFHEYGLLVHNYALGMLQQDQLTLLAYLSLAPCACVCVRVCGCMSTYKWVCYFLGNMAPAINCAHNFSLQFRHTQFSIAKT